MSSFAIGLCRVRAPQESHLCTGLYSSYIKNHNSSSYQLCEVMFLTSGLKYHWQTPIHPSRLIIFAQLFISNLPMNFKVKQTGFHFPLQSAVIFTVWPYASHFTSWTSFSSLHNNFQHAEFIMKTGWDTVNISSNRLVPYMFVLAPVNDRKLLKTFRAEIRCKVLSKSHRSGHRPPSHTPKAMWSQGKSMLIKSCNSRDLGGIV